MTTTCNNKRNGDVERSELNKYCIDIGKVCAVSKDKGPAALSTVIVKGEAAAGMAPSQSMLME